MAGAALWAHGHSGLWPVILVAALGGWTSDLVIYALARTHRSRDWVRRAASAAQSNRFFSRLLDYPFVLAVTFRFIPGARTLGPVALATASPLRPIRYGAITAVAAAIWAIILVQFGVVLRKALEWLLIELRPYQEIAFWAVLILASLILAWILRHRWMPRT